MIQHTFFVMLDRIEPYLGWVTPIAVAFTAIMQIHIALTLLRVNKLRKAAYDALAARVESVAALQSIAATRGTTDAGRLANLEAQTWAHFRQPHHSVNQAGGNGHGPSSYMDNTGRTWYRNAHGDDCLAGGGGGGRP